MVKSVDTLVEDIQNLFTQGHIANLENAEELGRAVAQAVVNRLADVLKEREPFRLRMSNIGKPDKQLWYEAHHEGIEAEELNASARIKFLFGDILEHLLIFLAKEAGHEVTHQQHQVEIDGIGGHMDCRIDGCLTDVKSASTLQFPKFATGSLRRDDAFGYMWQLAGYSQADDTVPEVTDGGFFVIDKTLGHICYMKVPADEFKLYDVKGRIAELKAIVASPDPPERCYEDEPDGKSGNRKLGVGCSYCKFKRACWPNMQVYFYSNGPRFLTTVVREPKVEKELVNDE